MGERTPDLKDAETPEELEHEVADIRGNMTGIVRELDRRRHVLFDWRAQLRKHALVLGLGTAGLVCVISGAVVLHAWRKRRRDQPLVKARRLREALSRMIANPELVAQPRAGVGEKALAAAASAVAGTLAKTAALWLVAPANGGHATIKFSTVSPPPKPGRAGVG